VTHFIEHYGLWFLFAIVCLESAGLWLPGETALIAAAVYAAKGHLSIAAVITVAAVAGLGRASQASSFARLAAWDKRRNASEPRRGQGRQA